MATLRQERAIGVVVVAVRGEVIWAYVFSDTELLTRHWTKLVGSYAAEGLGSISHGTASIADAQRFLDARRMGEKTRRGRSGCMVTAR